MKSLNSISFFIICMLILAVLSPDLLAQTPDIYPAIVQVIDRSGSMDFSNYMTPAKQRAQTFVGLMENGDQVGVISFSMTASSNYPLTTIVGSTTITGAQNAINGIQSDGNRTSIGSGLRAGRNMLNNSTVLGQKAMILLSDGLDNYAPFAVNVVPNIPASMKVYTIALGPQSDQGLLQWIAAQTGGTYHYAPNAAVLQQIYDAIAGDIRGYETYHAGDDNIAPLEEINISVDIDAAADFVKFTVTSDEEYSTQQTAIDMFLTAPDGQQIDPSNISDHGDLTSGFSYLSYRISEPPAGNWQMSILNTSTDLELSYNTLVSGRSAITMQPVQTADVYQIYDPFSIIVEISDNDIPISNCTVTASISLPVAEPRSNEHLQQTAFGDFSSERTDNVISFQNRNIELTLTETDPGRYEGIFYDTQQPGSYHIEIEAEIAAGGVTFFRNKMSSVYFATPDPLSAPFLLYPENSAQDVAKEVEFLWTPVLDAEHYHIQIAQGMDMLFDIDQIEENVITISLPDYDTEYMWRLRASNDLFDGAWSEIFTFTTTVPDVPVPANLEAYPASNGIMLTWEHPPADAFYGSPSFFKIYRDGEHHSSTGFTATSYLDEDVYSDLTYTYYITSVYSNGTESSPSNSVTIFFTSVDGNEDMVLTGGIRYNYPNPFNPETNIVFALPEAGHVNLSIYNVQGRLISKLKDGYLEKGEHTVVWKGLDMAHRALPTGVYFIRLESPGQSEQKKILLLK